MKLTYAKRPMLLVLATAAITTFFLSGCHNEAAGENGDDGQSAKTANNAEIQLQERDPAVAFKNYYEPVDAAVEPQVPAYKLPLRPDDICNIDTIPGAWRRQPVTDTLMQQGFAVTDRGAEEDIIQLYEDVRDENMPVFVTADTLLHLYHLQFDQTLKDIEEQQFHPQMVDFSKKLIAISQKQYDSFTGDLRQAARRNIAFFTVGLCCLKPDTEIPELVADPVKAELELIKNHSGFSTSPIFNYREDYSQYVPRGHYTRSETLKRYFKGLMWHGRIGMLLKGDTDVLPKKHDAKTQTLQACLIAATLYAPQHQSLLKTWNRLYSVTAFYVGLADDLMPYEYGQAIREVAGSAFDWSSLADKDTLFDLKSQLATYRAPKIYGGTGEVTLMPPFSAGQLDKLLADTQGMRLMGQRFVPDAYMMQQLGFPKAGEFTGDGKPFSMEMTQGGPQRCFPRGLDVMAVLGSQRAHHILERAGDTAYENYNQQLQKLRNKFGAQTRAQWNRNLYFSWLYSIRPLLSDRSEGYPTFMQTEAYKDRSLWAALSSWAQLRHDTILYAKQPYMPVAGAAAPGEQPPPPPPGYVEPLPEFYARMFALARMTRKGLADMNVLDDEGLNRLQRLEDIIANLLRISKIELRNEPISEKDAHYIKYIAGRLKGCIEGIEDQEDKVTIVADVLTDTNTGQCLEEGVGYVKMMLAAYRIPDGRIAVGVGPAMSYYEFKQPTDNRLTDEKWRAMLESQPPKPPQWTDSFYVPRRW